MLELWKTAMLSLEEVKALAAERVSPAVSMFLPFHPRGPEFRQDRTRLRNLAREAERRLVDRGSRSVLAREIVRPAVELADDADFWREEAKDGLAMFLGRDYARRYDMPDDVREELMVGDHFSVKPLLPLLADGGTFFILAVTKARAQLLEATRWHIREIKDVQMPAGVRAVIDETEYQDTVLGHPVSRPGIGVWPTHHGIGKVSAGETPEELRRTELIEYLHRVGAVVNEYFSGKPQPVVLAALPDIDGHLREIVKLKTLLPESLELNPDAVPLEELRHRAYERVRPMFAEARQQALDRFRTLLGNGNPRAGTRPLDVVDGARWGRVDSLFIADGARLWGRIGDGPEDVEIHDSRMAQDEDLLDRATIETMLHGGTVAVLPTGQLMAEGVIAAIFRW
jgi:hypothetical protein